MDKDLEKFFWMILFAMDMKLVCFNAVVYFLTVTMMKMLGCFVLPVSTVVVMHIKT